MRSEAIVTVQCDGCEYEVEIVVHNNRLMNEPEDSFSEQVSEELRAMSWIVTEESDICDECKENLGEKNSYSNQ